MKCRIYWTLVGILQPLIIVSLRDEAGVVDDRERIEQIAAVARRRVPRPVEVTILGGNCEPGVVIKGNEIHGRRAEPAIIKWLVKQIRLGHVHGGEGFEIEIIKHEEGKR